MCGPSLPGSTVRVGDASVGVVLPGLAPLTCTSERAEGWDHCSFRLFAGFSIENVVCLPQCELAGCDVAALCDGACVCEFLFTASVCVQ